MLVMAANASDLSPWEVKATLDKERPCPKNPKQAWQWWHTPSRLGWQRQVGICEFKASCGLQSVFPTSLGYLGPILFCFQDDL